MSRQFDRRVRPARQFPVETLEHRVLLATQTFNNFTPMNLFDDFNPPTPAFNYPVPLTVSGVSGTITEIRVTLYDVYHDRPADMDILITSPSGRSIIIMSDAGDGLAIPADNPIDLTFTDSASRDLPELAAITAGLYRPTNYDNDDFFPGNDVPIDAPTDTELMGLAAGDPNGEWRIFVVDDAIGSNGGVATGWGMTFVTGTVGPAAPSTPDMHPNSDRGASNSDDITNNNRPVFRGTATAGTQVRLFIDGVPDITGPISNGNYQLQLNAALTDGVHFISARALDAGGNEGPPSGDLTVTIDTVVPEVPSVPDLTPESDTGPSNTDNDTTDNTPTFVGNADGADIVQLIANTQVVGTGTVLAGNYTVTPTNPMAAGTYDFTVVAQDTAGNTTQQFNTLQVIIRGGVTPTPVITDVYARGSSWAPPDGAANVTFMEFLEAEGMGDDAWGYKLTSGATIPWVNVNQVVLRYDSALTSAPAAGGILVDGARSDYTVTTSLLDSRTALLSLNRVLGNLPTGGENGDRIRLTVPGAAAGGAAYTLDFKVLQGDVDGSGSVVAGDFSDVKARFFRNTNTPGPAGATRYHPFRDVDANGSILANDFSFVKARFFDNLPAAAASAPFSAQRIAADVLG